MGLKTNKHKGQYIYGKGFITRSHKFPMHGRGFIDSTIKAIKGIVGAIGGIPAITKGVSDVGNIVKNVRNVVKKPPEKNVDIEEVIKVIKGKGFRFTK